MVGLSGIALSAPPNSNSFDNNQNDNHSRYEQLPSYQQLAFEVRQLQQEIAKLNYQQKQIKKQQQPPSQRQTHPTSTASLKTTSTKKPKTSQYQKSMSSQTQLSPFGTFVTIGPSIDMPSYNSQSSDGSALIVNSPKINNDYRLLKRSDSAKRHLRQNGFATPTYPHLVFSGELGAQVTYTDPFVGNHSTDIDLYTAELDNYLQATDFFSGFFNFSYDNGSESDAPGRIGNSNISIDRGFLVIGNLEKSPFYASAGQLYPAFGRYSYASSEEPLTQDVGRIQARAINIGYHRNQPDTPYATVFIFRGDTKTNTADRINNGGFDVGFEFKDKAGFTADIGAGYIRNIADSQGMSSTGKSCTSGQSCFAGFDANNQNILNKQVPGADVHANISYQFLTLIGEYVTSTSSFNVNDLSFNNVGAKPRAADIEGDISFNALKLPLVWSLSYSRSWQALALNLPEYRYITSLTANIAKNTLLTVEYDRDKDYSTNDFANGGNGNSNVGNVAFSGTGQSSNTILSTLTLYF